MRWLTDFLHNLAVLFGRRREDPSSKLTLTGREMAMLACYDSGGFFTSHCDGSAEDSASCLHTHAGHAGSLIVV